MKGLAALSFPLVILCSLALAAQPPLTSSPHAPAPVHAPQDSLTFSVRAGEVLIIDLPAEPATDELVRYDIIRAPALSWLVDDSFFWRTQPQDAGSHNLLFRAVLPSASPDTLTVHVDVTE